MTKYRGYYIDHVVFNSKKDIDEHIKNELISGVKKLMKMFLSARYSAEEKMIISASITDKERILQKECGLTGAEIEKIEDSCYC